MHPAYSVILFTTASGAGYGLLFWLSIAAVIGEVPADRSLGLVGLGLGRFGAVRPLEDPHTTPNFVMREMGYRVARKHATRLRAMVIGVGFVVPIVATLMSLWTSATLGLPLAIVAVFAAAFGIVVERWLFFAQAQHVVTLYYGAERA